MTRSAIPRDAADPFPPARPEIPSQAMLLAAGMGVRMRPLTSDRAKPSLPFFNRPLLLHAFDMLVRHGVRRVVVNLHHHPESLKRIAAAEPPEGLEVVFSEEATILGTGGGIRNAMPSLDPEAPLLLLNADSLGGVDLPDLARSHAMARAAFGAEATLALRPRAHDDTYSNVFIDGAGRLCGIGEAGERGEAMTFIGLHILEPEAMARIAAEGAPDIVRDVYLPMLKEGRRLGAHRHSGWWVEIGTPALYLRAHLALLDETAFLSALPASAGAVREGGERSFVGPGCEGLPRATLKRSTLGPGCWLGNDSAVVSSVLGARVRVGRQARIEDSIVWEGVEVPGGHAVHNSLVLPPAPGENAIRSLPLR